MDAERDIIKFEVMNRLNVRYGGRRINFQIIDLRSGINTESLAEDMREGRILEVCFDSIDSARPFFIGLLGERYGWIPSPELRESIAKKLPEDRRGFMTDCGDVSVTELEILYGAIGANCDNIDHCLFFYRSPEAYKGIAQDNVGKYFDIECGKVSDMAAARKKELHTKIQAALSSRQEQWIGYTPTYNPEKQVFEGLHEFADLVYESLVKIIDKEISQDEQKQQKWWERERDTNVYIADQYVLETVDFTSKVSGGNSATFISGNPLSGKSTVLSQIYQQTTAPKHIAFVGMTSYSCNIRDILVRWLCEMGESRWENHLPDKKELSSGALFKLFQKKAEESGDVFFLDNIDWLADSEGMLGWLTPDVNIYISGSENAYRNLSSIHSFVRLSLLNKITPQEKERILENAELVYRFELPREIRTALGDDDVTVGDVTLTMKLMTGLSARDYKQIRLMGNGGIEGINDYLLDVFTKFKSCSEGRFRFTVERYAENVCENRDLMYMLGYIAFSKVGLRESDLANLMGDRWDPVSFAKAAVYFADYLISDTYNKKWRFRSGGYASQIAAVIDSTAGYVSLAECMMAYDDSDCMKRDVLLYYLIKSRYLPASIEYLSSRRHFDSYDDVSEWYALPLDLLKEESTFVSDIKECCSIMTDGEKAVFISHLLDHGMRFAENSKLYVNVVETCLMSVCVRNLTPEQAFSAGWVWTHAQGYLQHLIHGRDDLRKEVILKAIDAFGYCVELDPSDIKAKSMVTANVSGLMELYIASGEFDKVTELYSKYGI